MVQTLRLRGLCASTLLALAACSGAPNGADKNASTPTGDSPTAGAPAPAPAGKSAPQGGQGQQGQPSRQALIQQGLANARRSVDLNLFADARNEAAFVLELDNQNAEARDIVRRCNDALGDTPKTAAGAWMDLVAQDRIEAERQLSQVQREMDLGNAHMERGEFGTAIERFETALTVMRFSKYFQPGDATRQAAEQRLKDAIAAKDKADLDQLNRQKAASEGELNRIARDQAVAKELSVERLVEDANLSFQRGQYEKAVDRLDQALLIDPSNTGARAMRDLADRARHGSAMELHRERWRQEWIKAFADLQESNLPQTQTVVFDPARWAVVSQRKPAAYTPPAELESPENRAIIKRLEETVLEHNFASATVQDWATYYGNVTQVTFFVTQEVRDMPAESTTLTEFKLTRRSVADALKAIQAQTGVAYKIRDGLVHLVSPANAIGTLYLHRYNVGALVQGVKGHPGPNLQLVPPGDDTPLFPEEEGDPAPSVVDDGRLQELIKTTVAPDKWEGSPFTMGYQAGVLFVRADKDTHDKVDKLLNELRSHVGIQIDIESRFLKVEDSFLEDVGVDLKGLGNQAAQGLAGRGLETRQNAGFDDFGPKQQQNAASPGLVGTGTEPGVFFDDGGDGDLMARVENLYDSTLGGTHGGLSNGGGLSLQYAFLDDTEVEVVLRAVAKQERSEQIEAPRLLVYNNTRASMHFLRNISYIKDFEVEIAQAAAVANPVIGTVHDGVALDVRPVVDSDLKFITMELRPTVMSLSLPIPTFTTTLGVGQPISIQLPEVTLQRVRTTVTVPDGATMMLGGMRLVEKMNMNSGVPILKDLPGVSFFFSRKGNSVLNRKILVLIKAKIILMSEQEPESVALPDGSIISSK